MRWVWVRPSSPSHCSLRYTLLVSKALSLLSLLFPLSPTGRGNSPPGPTWMPLSIMAAWLVDRWSSSMRCTARMTRLIDNWWLPIINLTLRDAHLIPIILVSAGSLDPWSIQVWRLDHNLWDDIVWLPRAEGDLLALRYHWWSSSP